MVSVEHVCLFARFQEKKQDVGAAAGSMKSSDDELMCSVCLEQVSAGELIRSLPCMHQVNPTVIIFPFT